ncbi:hypothetical protein B0H16DRAFT_1570639 [Mycena metata]|uniref:Uncharacterized protein n=1 Tax=Mycena metata TaxID=1033252 RepID=A0AAD7IA06_9AGAR|nr:hypothetical protein B0H16DRAFT_1570639 [Mycena metata]
MFRMHDGHPFSSLVHRLTTRVRLTVTLVLVVHGREPCNQHVDGPRAGWECGGSKADGGLELFCRKTRTTESTNEVAAVSAPSTPVRCVYIYPAVGTNLELCG